MTEAEKKLTVSDIGRIGGERVKEKYGPDYYREIGRKGGETMRRRTQAEDPDFYSRIAKQSKSAKKNSPGYGTTTASEAGKRGGAELKRRYGREYYGELGHIGGTILKEQRPGFFSEIGPKGGQTMRDRHQGDDYYSKLGSEGGIASRERHGSEHFRRAGQIGGTNRAKNAATKKQAALEASLTEPQTS